jgi:hypothetical protein
MSRLRDKFFKGCVFAHVNHMDDHLLEVESLVLAINFPSNNSQQNLVDSFDLDYERKIIWCIDALVTC